jgi:hypothetical protein
VIPPDVGLLRGIAADTHLDTCTVQEPLEVFDTTGALVTTYQDVDTMRNLPCRVGPPQSPTETIAGGQVVRRAYRLVAFTVDLPPVSGSYRIRTGSGTILEVIGGGPSTYEAERQVLCEEVL